MTPEENKGSCLLRQGLRFHVYWMQERSRQFVIKLIVAKCKNIVNWHRERVCFVQPADPSVEKVSNKRGLLIVVISLIS